MTMQQASRVRRDACSTHVRSRNQLHEKYMQSVAKAHRGWRLGGSSAEGFRGKYATSGGNLLAAYDERDDISFRTV
jgi:hypothetical protein